MSACGTSSSQGASQNTSTTTSTTTTTVPPRTVAPVACSVLPLAIVRTVFESLVERVETTTTIANENTDVSDTLCSYDNNEIMRGKIAPIVTLYVRTGIVNSIVPDIETLTRGFAIPAGLGDGTGTTEVIKDVGQSAFVYRSPDANAESTSTIGTTTLPTSATSTTNPESSDPTDVPIVTAPAGTPTAQVLSVGTISDQAWVVVSVLYYETTPKASFADEGQVIGLLKIAADSIADPKFHTA